MRVAIEAVQAGGISVTKVLNSLPGAVYVTDEDGCITHFNSGCVALAKRTPAIREDRWCINCKLYTLEGEFLPYDQCPAAVALREKVPVRGVQAVGERPDGTHIRCEPYPTPFFDDEGRLAGVVNLLIDVTAQRQISYLQRQAERSRRLVQSVSDTATKNRFEDLAHEYEGLALKLAAEATTVAGQGTVRHLR